MVVPPLLLPPAATDLVLFVVDLDLDLGFDAGILSALAFLALVLGFLDVKQSSTSSSALWASSSRFVSGVDNRRADEVDVAREGTLSVSERTCW